MQLFNNFILVFLLSSLLAVASNVIEATDKTFDTIINQPDAYTFVEFYASWCGHCKNLAPLWEELADSYANVKKVQIVKIDADKHSKTGRKYGIRGFPTLKLFSPIDSANGKQQHPPKEYEGGRDIQAFKEFITANTGAKAPAVSAEDHVIHLSDDNYLNQIEGKHALFSVTASWCGHCKKLKPDWSKLAAVFKNDKDSVVIGDVLTTDVDAEAIMEKFQVSSFPTIIYVAPEDVHAENPEFYRGGRNLQDLIDFVNEKTQIGRTADGLLGENAGRLSVVDANIVKIIQAASDEQKALIAPVIEELQQFTDAATAYSVKYYTKLLNKLSNGETDFFQKEYNRLSNILTKNAGSISGKIHDNLVKRINILKKFLDVEKEETGNVRDEL